MLANTKYSNEPIQLEYQTKVAVSGGLGNQLFQIAAALNNSESDEIVVDFEISGGDEQVLKEFEFPQTIHFKTASGSRRITKLLHNLALRSTRIQNNSFIARIIKKVLEKIIGLNLNPRQNVLIQADEAFSQTKKNANGSYLIGYFQNYSSIELHYDFFARLKLKQVSRNFNEELETIRAKSPLILHLRLGDYLTENQFGIPSETYFEEGIKILRMNKKDKEIWVFSNDPELAKLYLSFLDSYKTHFVSSSKFTAGETLELMKYGSGYVISNSTFAWWGAYLRKDRNSDVVAPQPWFEKLIQPSEICPPDWVRLSAYE